jgi:hypothetical protein
VERNGSKGVLVFFNGLANFRPIVIGLQDGQRAAVLEGIKEGEMVILNPAGIEPGKKLRPEIKSGMGKQN